MANIYSFSRNALLRRIGLVPGKKQQVFFISLVALTIPMGYGYNSIALILFVLFSILAAQRHTTWIRFTTSLPAFLFILMAFSLLWSIDFKISLKALGREAALLFIPLAFCLNRPLKFRHVNQVLNNYGLGMCVFALYFFIRAVVRYFNTGDTNVFFYHEFSTFKINAIYLSALFSLALFIFLAKKNKTFWGYTAIVFLLFVIFLLSSKNVILIDVFLVIVYYLFFSPLPKKAKLSGLAAFLILFAGLAYFGNIGRRFSQELDPVTEEKTGNGVHNVTINEAWNQDTFNENDYFNGTAFRTYQIRIFKEMLQEDGVFFTGYGLSASQIKIEEKGVEHDVDHSSEGAVSYNKMNFHNQYVEVFADLGFFGFFIVVILLLISLYKGLKSKYFVHIAFAVLMISLFLTESFLWRQRGVVFFTLFYCLFNELVGLWKRKMPEPTPKTT
ncbi:O-antigen ligase family protein [Flavobacterium rhizosphaerae]|uniref:O-antigen ligase family protein n=1 Tax=Flavobacterium rhizosphaerae TaxID=3163298 RepID=A0ABW8YYL9_9FLAO